MKDGLIQVVRLERVVFQVSEALSETSPSESVAVSKVVINLSLLWPSTETGGVSSRD